jgi:hypothetical protein
MPDRATHCPGCGIPITDWVSEVARMFGIPPHMIWPCGCWITTEQAEPILASRAWAVWDRKRRARRKR